MEDQKWEEKKNPRPNSSKYKTKSKKTSSIQHHKFMNSKISQRAVLSVTYRIYNLYFIWYKHNLQQSSCYRESKGKGKASLNNRNENRKIRLPIMIWQLLVVLSEWPIDYGCAAMSTFGCSAAFWDAAFELAFTCLVPTLEEIPLLPFVCTFWLSSL